MMPVVGFSIHGSMDSNGSGFSVGAGHINLMMEEGEEKIASTYQANHDRLHRAKGELIGLHKTALRTWHRRCLSAVMFLNKIGPK
ncbi:MAG: hypothetical protein GVY02_00095 [Bacteroidetes bacterium]|jgi:hypothetical protein|nr:hypothetical protein [Bacteroidota bacterium]